MLDSTKYTAGRQITLEEAIAAQSQGSDFICRSCRSWLGGVGCKRNYFIAFEGAHIPQCAGYEKENRKDQPHE